MRPPSTFFALSFLLIMGMLLGMEAGVKRPSSFSRVAVAPSGRKPGPAFVPLRPASSSSSSPDGDLLLQKKKHTGRLIRRRAVEARGPEELSEEEQRPKAKKPMAISVAKQLRRMKEPGPAQTTVLLARMMKNAFTQTPIDNFPLLLGDIGILCSTRLMEDMILVPDPYLDIEHIHQIEAYTGLDLMHTSPSGWMHAYSTFADGMQMGLAWVLAVVMARGFPVSREATTTDHGKSLRTTLTTFAMAAFFRVTMTSLQAAAMDHELDLILVLVDLASLFMGIGMWRALFTQLNRITV